MGPQSKCWSSVLLKAVEENNFIPNIGINLAVVNEYAELNLMFTKNTHNEIVCKLRMQNENEHFLEVCKSSERIFIIK